MKTEQLETISKYLTKRDSQVSFRINKDLRNLILKYCEENNEKLTDFFIKCAIEKLIEKGYIK